MTGTITPSGVFSPQQAAPIQIYKGEDLQQGVAILRSRFDNAMRKDRTEVSNAQAAANGPMCSDGYDKTATQANFATFESNAEAVMVQVETTVSSWAPTAQAVVNNQGPYDDWNEILKELDSIITDSQGLKISSWQSSAGEAYRNHAEKLTSHAKSLLMLSTDTRNGVEAICRLQAVLAQAIAAEINNAIEATTEPIPSPPIKAEGDFRQMGDSAWASFTFYSRTARIVASLQHILNKLNQYSAGSGWENTSTEIGASLERAVVNANSAQVNEHPTVTATPNIESSDLEKSPADLCFNEEGAKAKDSFW